MVVQWSEIYVQQSLRQVSVQHFKYFKCCLSNTTVLIWRGVTMAKNSFHGLFNREDHWGFPSHSSCLTFDNVVQIGSLVCSYVKWRDKRMLTKVAPTCSLAWTIAVSNQDTLQIYCHCYHMFCLCSLPIRRDDWVFGDLMSIIATDMAHIWNKSYGTATKTRQYKIPLFYLSHISTLSYYILGKEQSR